MSTEETGDWAVAIIALWGEAPALHGEFDNAGVLLEWAQLEADRLIRSASSEKNCGGMNG